MLERTKSRVELHSDREQKSEIFTDYVRNVVQLGDYIVIDRRKNYERTPISPTEKTARVVSNWMQTLKVFFPPFCIKKRKKNCACTPISLKFYRMRSLLLSGITSSVKNVTTQPKMDLTYVQGA
jgi:hypothetical protein